MVFAAAVGRAVTCLAMAAVVDSLLLFPAAFTALVLSKAHAVAKSSLVPAAVDSEERLVEANAKLSLTGGVAGFLAAGPAVLILKLVGGRLGAAGGGRWCSRATAVAALRIAPVRPERAQPGPQRCGPSCTTPGIRLAATSMAVLRAVVGFVTFLVAFVFRRDGVPSWWFGVVLATSMAGTLLGAAAAPRLRERVREESILTGCLVLVAAGGLLAARLDSRPVIAVFTAIVGFSASAGKLAFDSLVQRDAPEAAQGRSFARFETEFQLVWVVGALIPVVLSIPRARASSSWPSGRPSPPCPTSPAAAHSRLEAAMRRRAEYGPAPHAGADRCRRLRRRRRATPGSPPPGG